MTDITRNRLLSQKSVCQFLDCSRMTLWRLRKESSFPKPSVTIRQSDRWSLADIQEWLNSQRAIDRDGVSDE